MVWQTIPSAGLRFTWKIWSGQFYETPFQVEQEALSVPDSDIELEMWRFQSDPANWGISGALMWMRGYSSGGNTPVYFSCEDCAVEASRIVEAGGKLDRSKMSIGDDGLITLALDTEGNTIGLHSLK